MPNMLTSRWLSLVFILVTTALLLGVVGYTARVLADAPPNDEAQPDVSTRLWLNSSQTSFLMRCPRATVHRFGMGGATKPGRL